MTFEEFSLWRARLKFAFSPILFSVKTYKQQPWRSMEGASSGVAVEVM